MRLFISYARVDKYSCTQIVDILNVHEVWYDTRMHVGQHWWSQIQSRLEWCDGLIYLLSPDSVASKYCQREYAIARSLGKVIFPIVIHPNAPIPPELAHLQAVDMRSGMTTEAVTAILNALYIAERKLVRAHKPVPVSGSLALFDAPASPQEVETIISEAAEAFDGNDYDRAVFLLKQAKASGYKSRYIDLESMLREAEAALEVEAKRREAEREYAPIAALVKHEATRAIGLEAFWAFRKSFPNYDPENLMAYCLLPDLTVRAG